MSTTNTRTPSGWPDQKHRRTSKERHNLYAQVRRDKTNRSMKETEEKVRTARSLSVEERVAWCRAHGEVCKEMEERE